MSRIFVIDPVCAMEYGHSLNALKYFADMARRYGGPVEMVASRHLPPPADGQADGIARFFEFHYDFALKIDRRPAPQSLIEGSGGLSPLAGATLDFSRFLTAKNCTAADTLLFPSIDFYSLIGLLNVLEGMPPADCPRLLIRLIGVMETGARDIDPGAAMAMIISRLKDHAASGAALSLCAETPKYADVLSGKLDTEVPVVPYFAPGIAALKMPADGPVTFLSGGSARPDKGLYRLRGIIDAVNDRIGPARARFIVQGPPDHGYNDNAAYMRGLHALPNVSVLPGILPYAGIVRSFADSHVALMPYDAGTYALRGSAMLMEAMMFNRLAVCQAGTGFAEQARLYNAGETCQTDADFAAAICLYAQMPPARIHDQAARARHYYLEDVETSCRHWIGAAA